MSPDQILALKSLVERGIEGYFVISTASHRQVLSGFGMTIVEYAVDILGMAAEDIEAAYNRRDRDCKPWSDLFLRPSTRAHTAIASSAAPAMILKCHGFTIIPITRESYTPVYAEWQSGIVGLAERMATIAQNTKIR